MRISDWSSDVCSSDLLQDRKPCASDGNSILNSRYGSYMPNEDFAVQFAPGARREPCQLYLISPPAIDETFAGRLASALDAGAVARSEEHTSELQSLMRSSYAVLCLKKTTHINRTMTIPQIPI